MEHLETLIIRLREMGQLAWDDRNAYGTLGDYELVAHDLRKAADEIDRLMKELELRRKSAANGNRSLEQAESAEKEIRRQVGASEGQSTLDAVVEAILQTEREGQAEIVRLQQDGKVLFDIVRHPTLHAPGCEGDWRERVCIRCNQLSGHNSRPDVVESLQADLEDEASNIAALEAEVERLRAGIWEMVGILGFDQGGAEHHHLTYPDIVTYGIEKATEMRKDYDVACDETAAAYKGSGMTWTECEWA